MHQQSSKRTRLDDDATAATSKGKKEKEMKAFDGVPAIQLALRANGGSPSAGIIDGACCCSGLEDV